MKTYFVVSDVHSYYNELMTALNKQGFDRKNKNHIFVSLGDLCDRGPDAVKCLDFVNNLPLKRKILIRGNHEDLLEEAICRRYFMIRDIHNHTNDTVEQVTGIYYDEMLACESMLYNKKWNKYISSCVDYAEIGSNIFVHGWIPNNVKDWRNATNDDWKEARWLNGMKEWSTGIIEDDKTIWCGHWHSSWGHAHLHDDGVEWINKIETYSVLDDGTVWPYVKHEPFIDKGIVAMDACTAVSGIINCKTIEVDE